jgi:hypothetical protein
MGHLWIIGLLMLAAPGAGANEETFVVIQKIEGNRITVTPAATGTRGSGAGQGRGAGGSGAERGQRRGEQRAGRGGGAAAPVVLTIPADAKITTASRERRTFEFRVGAELAGGLRHDIFTQLTQPLQARIVTDGRRVVELNVLAASTDINQATTDLDTGRVVVAVQPKRPPMKQNTRRGARSGERR